MPFGANQFHRGHDADAWFDQFSKEQLSKGAAFSEPMREMFTPSMRKGREHGLLGLYGQKNLEIQRGTNMHSYNRHFQMERIDFHARPDLTHRKDF